MRGRWNLRGSRKCGNVLVTTDATEEASSEFLFVCYFAIGYGPQ